MSSPPVSAESSAPVAKPAVTETSSAATAPRGAARWRRYISPVLTLLLALAVLVTVTRNWNAWEGGRVEQVTDDAHVRGDLTPLSTKVPGIVRAVHVEDFQQVHKGDLADRHRNSPWRKRNYEAP